MSVLRISEAEEKLHIFNCLVGTQLFRSSVRQQSEQSLAGGGDRGKDQLWPERGEKEEKGRASQSTMQMVVGYRAF